MPYMKSLSPAMLQIFVLKRSQRYCNNMYGAGGYLKYREDHSVKYMIA